MKQLHISGAAIKKQGDKDKEVIISFDNGSHISIPLSRPDGSLVGLEQFAKHIQQLGESLLTY